MAPRMKRKEERSAFPFLLPAIQMEIPARKIKVGAQKCAKTRSSHTLNGVADKIIGSEG